MSQCTFDQAAGHDIPKMWYLQHLIFSQVSSQQLSKVAPANLIWTVLQFFPSPSSCSSILNNTLLLISFPSSSFSSCPLSLKATLVFTPFWGQLTCCFQSTSSSFSVSVCFTMIQPCDGNIAHPKGSWDAMAGHLEEPTLHCCNILLRFLAVIILCTAKWHPCYKNAGDNIQYW